MSVFGNAFVVYDGRREMVGIIMPTKSSGSLVGLIKILPDGIRVISLFNNVRHGKIEEFQAAIAAYEEKFAWIFSRLTCAGGV